MLVGVLCLIIMFVIAFGSDRAASPNFTRPLIEPVIDTYGAELKHKIRLHENPLAARSVLPDWYEASIEDGSQIMLEPGRVSFQVPEPAPQKVVANTVHKAQSSQSIKFIKASDLQGVARYQDGQFISEEMLSSSLVSQPYQTALATASHKQSLARDAAKLGVPQIGVIVGGLGIDKTITRLTIDHLPHEVTLAFVPFAPDLQAQIDYALRDGHDVLLEIPMEDFGHTSQSIDSLTLLATPNHQHNGEKLERLLSMATGYTGVINYMGGRFLTSSDWPTFLNAIKQRNLVFIHDGTTRISRRSSSSNQLLGFISADAFIDGSGRAIDIEAHLATIEAEAQKKGYSLVMMIANERSIGQIKAWSEQLKTKHIQLNSVIAVSNVFSPDLTVDGSTDLASVKTYN